MCYVNRCIVKGCVGDGGLCVGPTMSSELSVAAV